MPCCLRFIRACSVLRPLDLTYASAVASWAQPIMFLRCVVSRPASAYFCAAVLLRACG